MSCRQRRSRSACDLLLGRGRVQLPVRAFRIKSELQLLQTSPIPVVLSESVVTRLWPAKRLWRSCSSGGPWTGEWREVLATFPGTSLAAPRPGGGWRWLNRLSALC